MLQKKNRIVNQTDIKRTLGARNRFYKDSISILLNPNQLETFRLLIIVGKKIHKRAVKRNSIRRRISAIFEKIKSENNLPSGRDCIILIKDKKILEEDILDSYEEYITKTIHFKLKTGAKKFPQKKHPVKKAL